MRIELKFKENIFASLEKSENYVQSLISSFVTEKFNERISDEKLFLSRLQHKSKSIQKNLRVLHRVRMFTKIDSMDTIVENYQEFYLLPAETSAKSSQFSSS